MNSVNTTTSSGLVSNINKQTTKYYIINTIFFTIFILLFLTYFKSKLPKYTEYVYIIISILFLMCAGLMMAEQTNILYKLIYSKLFLLPFIALSYIHIRYKDTFNNPSINFDTYNSLTNISTTLSLLQLLIIITSFESTNLTNLYGNILLSLCNMLCIGLIWRDVAFYITDG